ncbi:MAG: hypothetical protein IKP65_04510 [Alphaproteobacteria bacterium]|nr:hypothetical protein [Alphaproteobacteria bacterium]
MKKYNLLISDGYERYIESILDDDINGVAKQTAHYVLENVTNQLVFFTLLIDGKKADQTNWSQFLNLYKKYAKVIRKISSLNKDFEC